MVSLATLLSPQAEIVHRTRRRFFEKRIVRHESGNYVLYRFASPGKTRRLAKLLIECEAAGVPMQRLLHDSSGWWSGLKHFGFWLVASYEQGETWNVTPVQAAQMASLAKALARLHSIESLSPGPIFKKRSFLRKKQPDKPWHAECLAVVRATAGLNDLQKQEMTAWLHASANVFAEPSAYQLVHGDLYAKNVLVKDGQHVRLIDYELAAFEHAGFEFAGVLIRFTSGRNRKHRAEFLKTYLNECLPGVKEAWSRHAPEFLIYALLRLAWSRLRRAHILSRRGKIDDSIQLRQQLDRYVRGAYALVQALKAGLRDPEKLLVVYQRANSKP
jgi:Ser/Thr protein kinase RdoA (MazF antagonist)